MAHSLLPSRSFHAFLFLAAAAVWPAAARAATEAMLLAPAEIHAGGRSSATITAFDGATRAPAEVPVTLRLIDGENRIQILATGSTGPSGHAELGFEVPAAGAGSYSIEAAIGGLAQSLRVQTTLSDAPAILIETDKPIYKPSQTIQGRVLLLDNALRPRAGEVVLAFHDAKGIRIDKKQLTANEYGVAPFELRLASEVNFGVWKLRASRGGVETSRDVRVENYVLPRYELGARFARSWVLSSEAIEGTVQARYFFGRPVDGRVEITAKKYVAAWETFGRAEGTFSQGEMRFSLPAPGFVAGTPGASGLGTVTLEIAATDSTGYSQSTTEVLTVSAAPLVLGLIARAPNLKPGMPAEVLVTSEWPDGTPRNDTVSVKATFFDWGERTLDTRTFEVATDRGAGSLSLLAPEDTARAELVASARSDGLTATARLELTAGYSPSSSFLSLTRPGADSPARVGEELVFTATSTHPGTVFYDVYAGGRTVFSGTSRSREVRFLATADMAPRAKVVAYVINPNNEVSADTAAFRVEVPAAISIQTQVSNEKLKPGDEVTLTIDAGTRTMVGLSIVDLSVLALGKSRLHLGEVFAELERRFMEPQVETHDDGAGDVVGGPGFWRGPTSPGAREVLEKAGLKLATTGGITVPMGRFLWALDMMAVPGAPPAAEKSDGGGSAPEAVRVRQFFPETWVWNPVLLTDESGRATLNLTVPDSITGWQLSAMGSSPQGLGFGERQIVVFQDFFVEPDLPAAVTRGEEFPLRVQIYNYLDVPQTVALTLGSGTWFEALGESALTVEVPAGSATSAHFPIRPRMLGEHRVEILARGSVLSDAVLRAIRIDPEGQPVEEVFNSVIRAGETVGLDTSLPEYAVPGSGKAILNITPSPVAQTLSGVSNLLNMPFGCGEQNMISLAPDVEVLRYLRAIDQLMPEVQAEAEHFINVGYQRELTFQTDDGGFAAFGGAEGSLWLTAFVLSTFSGAREVRDIDEGVLARAAGMLVGRQNPDGSFRTDDFLIHKEMDGGLSNLYAMAAYVANALADYGADAVKPALGKAAGFLRDRRSTVNDDAYALSIAAVALGKVAGFEAVATQTVDRLLQIASDEGIGLHWEPYPTETTGYAAMALLAQDRPQAAQAVEWLSTRRNSLGGYGESTQDTVVAIRALIAAAMKVRADLDVTLTVLEGDAPLGTLRVDSSNYDLLQSFELPAGRSSGLALRSEGRGNVGYQVARKFHVPGTRLPPPRDMGIEVVYQTEGIEVDETVDVVVRVRYTGFKKETGMTIVDVGIPTGFEAVRASLDALVEAKTVSRADVAGRKVIFYLDSLLRDTPVEFRFQVKALYPVRAEPPISRVYEYYDPAVQASTQGPGVVVQPPGPRPFVRGDANSDGRVNIADPVAILHGLYLGSGMPRCPDRSDADDDGRVNITDPIVVLEHLFLGGHALPPPYPEAGLDPTPDRWDC